MVANARIIRIYTCVSIDEMLYCPCRKNGNPPLHCGGAGLLFREVEQMNYRGYHHIKWEDRLSIEQMLKINTKPTQIAGDLGVCVKTVYNIARTWQNGSIRKICGKEFDTHICETTLYNWIYRGDVFLNLTEEHLPYKGNHRKPEDRDRQKRASPAKGTLSNSTRRKQQTGKLSVIGKWIVL